MTQPLSEPRLPALRRDARGQRRVDIRAVFALALPLMLNSAVQLMLNLTDTWFIGRLSMEAMAAIGATHFLAIVFLLGLGGVGLCVQTLVAQAYGGARLSAAGHSAWLGLWGAALTIPLFIAIAYAGRWLFTPFGLDADVGLLAHAWWWPRLLGGPFAVALWTLTGFFNGIGRTRVTFFVMVVVGIANAVLNEIFIFRLGWGIAGSGWATTLALAGGAAFAMALFLSRSWQETFRTRAGWRPDVAGLRRLFALGIPTGLFPAVDLVSISLFQLMQVRLGIVQGAATQIVMTLTSMAYLPAMGIALAGTTLVGQSIGAGDHDWARRMGNTVIVMSVIYMGAVGVLIALAGPWLVPLFVDPSQPGTREVVTLGVTLIWIAGAYQLFDAVNLASAFCLRGAGDVTRPTLYLIALAWFGFVPLAHMLSFESGQGWIAFLPQFGWGAVGGWTAALIYIVALGVMMGMRWRSGAWRRIRLT